MFSYKNFLKKYFSVLTCFLLKPFSQIGSEEKLIVLYHRMYILQQKSLSILVKMNYHLTQSEAFFLNGCVCTVCSHQAHHPASKYSVQSISHLSMTKTYSEEHSEGECEQHTYCCYSQRRAKQKEVGPSNQYSIYFFLVRNTEHIEQNIFIFTYTYMCIYILFSDLSCSPRKAQQNILLATQCSHSKHISNSQNIYIQ